MELDPSSPSSSGAASEFPCSQCGAKLTFAPGTSSLRCPYCGNVESIAVSQAAIVEYDLGAGLQKLQRTRARELATQGAEVQCEGCGARAVVTRQSDHCAFCGSPRIVRRAGDEETIVPESLLPFAIEERAATEAFRKWVASRWLAPGDLRKRAQRQGMDGVYLPYWTYDSETTTRYTGMRGEHYWVTEHYVDSDGKSKTRQVMKTRWYPASGKVYVHFDDVLVCASSTLPGKLVDSLAPWDLEALHPYQAAYLSGFTAERYGVTLDQGFALAEQRMEPEIDAAIRRDIGGDEQNVLTRQIRHANTTFKHLLLPLWISSFRYGNKVYRVIVNARTGQVAGERPWSAIKITLLVLLALVIIGVIVYFATR